MPPTDTIANPLPKKEHGWLNKVVLVLCVASFITSVVLLMLWKPWQPNVKASDRTVSVTGDSSITAVPDEYIFTPSYDFTSASSQTALANMTTQSNAIVAKLKSLGVANSAIKTDSSGYSGGGIELPVSPVPVSQSDGTTTYMLDLTVTIDSSDLAQKVQNYLVSTNPTGDVSPDVEFSSAKQKTLQNQGRNQAEQDARSKANQSAKNLGFKVLAVKSVQDGSLASPIMPLENGVSAGTNSATSSPSLTLQPGQNTLNYSVNVVYYIH